VHDCISSFQCDLHGGETYSEIWEVIVMQSHGFMYEWGWWVVKAGGVVMVCMAAAAAALVIWYKTK
jgi:hypothetical protein